MIKHYLITPASFVTVIARTVRKFESDATVSRFFKLIDGLLNLEVDPGKVETVRR